VVRGRPGRRGGERGERVTPGMPVPCRLRDRRPRPRKAAGARSMLPVVLRAPSRLRSVRRASGRAGGVKGPREPREGQPHVPQQRQAVEGPVREVALNPLRPAPGR